MGSRDHSFPCAFCGYDRSRLNDLKCECDDNVACGTVSRELADKARHIAEARDEACDIADAYIPEITRHPVHDTDRTRIAELRNVGKAP